MRCGRVAPDVAASRSGLWTEPAVRGTALPLRVHADAATRRTGVWIEPDARQPLLLGRAQLVVVRVCKPVRSGPDRVAGWHSGCRHRKIFKILWPIARTLRIHAVDTRAMFRSECSEPARDVAVLRARHSGARTGAVAVGQLSAGRDHGAFPGIGQSARSGGQIRLCARAADGTRNNAERYRQNTDHSTISHGSARAAGDEADVRVRCGACRASPPAAAGSNDLSWVITLSATAP